MSDEEIPENQVAQPSHILFDEQWPEEYQAKNDSTVNENYDVPPNESKEIELRYSNNDVESY
jgi:hypothetical protein